MIHTLKCPACGAPMDYDDETAGHSVRCPYCNNQVVIPGLNRRHQAPNISVQIGGGASKMPAFILALVLVFAGLAIAIVYFVVRGASDTVSEATRTATTARQGVPSFPTFPPKPANTPPATDLGYAKVLLRFGGEGIGPGNFKDARSIAVDAEGCIYVGEYLGGRVQVFDQEGKFLTQWTVDPKMPLRGMAADRRGTIYVVQRGQIQRYEGPTGKPLGAVQAGRESGRFDDVCVTADGGLIAAAQSNGDDIVRFDPSGKISKVIRAAVSGVTDRSELNLRVAGDGLNHIYALGSFNEAVFKFSPDGRFLNKFGGAGGEPGQFRAVHAIAVDNQGRVYVSDVKGVQVFDSEGRYLDVFKPAPVSFGLTFGDKNELYVAARTEVVKLALNRP